MDNFKLTKLQRKEIAKYFFQCSHLIGWSTLPDYFLPREEIDESNKEFIKIRDKYLNKGLFATGEDAYKLSQGSKDKNLGIIIWQVKSEFINNKKKNKEE